MRNLTLHGQENRVTVLAVIPTDSIAETVRCLKGSSTPVVLSDRDLPDGSWRELLAEIQTLSRPPRLVVTSWLADERLSAEALNLGCHDVLAQPFRASELFRVLNFAWRSWRSEEEDCGSRAQGGSQRGYLRESNEVTKNVSAKENPISNRLFRPLGRGCANGRRIRAPFRFQPDAAPCGASLPGGIA